MSDFPTLLHFTGVVTTKKS